MIINLQYISDSSGKTTGVFIPISEWNELRAKYKGIDQEKIDIPEWQIAEVRNRIENHKINPEEALDFDQAIEDIGRSL